MPVAHLDLRGTRTRRCHVAFGRLWLALALAVCVCTPAIAASASGLAAMDVQTWKLDNGLRVVFAARQGAPLVSVQMVYHVGSRDEKPRQHGMARVMRELMFRGSQKVPPGVHTRLIVRAGGQAGSTGDEDITVFHNTLPTPYLDLALSLEADRMRSLKLFEGSLTSVRVAALAARQRQIDRSPIGNALELLRATMFKGHPYARGTVGSAADLRGLTISDCQVFYDTYFKPSNATLVIAGAVEAAQVRRLVDQHFSALAGGAPVQHPAPPVPVSLKGGMKIVRLPIALPMVAIGAPLPRLSASDRAAVVVLAEALAGGSAGRLSQNLVGPQRPTVAAGGAPALFEDAGMLVLFAVHQPGNPAEGVRRAVLDQLAQVRDRPLDPNELAQARLRAAAEAGARMATAAGVASELGSAWVTQGDAEQALLRPEQLLAVTATDVGRVANLYLKESALSILQLALEVVRKPGVP